MERYTVEEIWDMDGGMSTAGNDRLRHSVACALSKVPKTIVDYVFERCIFLMPIYEERGCFVPKKVIRDKSIIMLSERLDEKEMERTILHEVAHSYLGHRSVLLCDLSEREGREQEKEADGKVDEWLRSRT